MGGSGSSEETIIQNRSRLVFEKLCRSRFRKSPLRFALLGSKGVGVKSISNALDDHEISAGRFGRGFDCSSRTWNFKGSNFLCYIARPYTYKDQSRRRRFCFKDVDAAIIVFDLTEKKNGQVRDWIVEFFHQNRRAQLKTFPFLLLGNKCELVNGQSRRFRSEIIFDETRNDHMRSTTGSRRRGAVSNRGALCMGTLRRQQIICVLIALRCTDTIVYCCVRSFLRAEESNGGRKFYFECSAHTQLNLEAAFGRIAWEALRHRQEKFVRFVLRSRHRLRKKYGWKQNYGWKIPTVQASRIRHVSERCAEHDLIAALGVRAENLLRFWNHTKRARCGWRKDYSGIGMEIGVIGGVVGERRIRAEWLATELAVQALPLSASLDFRSPSI